MQKVFVMKNMNLLHILDLDYKKNGSLRRRHLGFAERKDKNSKGENNSKLQSIDSTEIGCSTFIGFFSVLKYFNSAGSKLD